MKVLSLTTTLIAALSLTSFAGSYTVKAGDTVSSISRKHKVSVSSIMKWNKISDPTKLRIGQALSVSSSSKKSTSSRSTSSKTGYYKVAKGDTFYSIARRHKMSVNHLRGLNPKVSSDRIAPGQSIAVSGKPVSVAKTTKKRVVQKTVSKPAPKKISISAANTLAKKTAGPAPKKETVAVVEKQKSTPISTPPAPPVVEDPELILPAPSPPAAVASAIPTASTTSTISTAASPSSVASIILTDETTFDAFASKHGTNTSQLNALNGWNLPKGTVLARGSEIYVPQ